MMKKQLLMALGVSVMMQSASAASVTSITANGNNVNNYFDAYGTSELGVEFVNLQSVQIDFDNGLAGQDDVWMSITNNSGTGWSGFDFTLVGTGVGIFGPFTLENQTGFISDFVFYNNDPANDLSKSVALTFDPLEYVGLWNVSGSIDTSLSSTYSLILTPTVVPVPAAVWLFGSGLLGLMGVARRRL